MALVYLVLLRQGKGDDLSGTISIVVLLLHLLVSINIFHFLHKSIFWAYGMKEEMGRTCNV